MRVHLAAGCPVHLTAARKQPLAMRLELAALLGIQLSGGTQLPFTVYRALSTSLSLPAILATGARRWRPYVLGTHGRGGALGAEGDVWGCGGLGPRGARDTFAPCSGGAERVGHGGFPAVRCSAK